MSFRINKNLVVRKFTFPNIKEGSIIEYEYKIKSDFVDYSIKNEFPERLIHHLKNLSIDEIVRILPVGQFKLLPIEKGELKYDFNNFLPK